MFDRKLLQMSMYRSPQDFLTKSLRDVLADDGVSECLVWVFMCFTTIHQDLCWASLVIAEEFSTIVVSKKLCVESQAFLFSITLGLGDEKMEKTSDLLALICWMVCRIWLVCDLQMHSLVCAVHPHAGSWVRLGNFLGKPAFPSTNWKRLLTEHHQPPSYKVNSRSRFWRMLNGWGAFAAQGSASLNVDLPYRRRI